MKKWTDEEIDELRREYPVRGQIWCAERFGVAPSTIRSRVSRMGLKLDRTSEHWREFQERAAKTKVGRKRPDQAKVMKRLFAEGKIGKPNDEQRKAMSDRAKAWHASNEHPRGARGMTHSADVKAAQSARSLKYWANITDEERVRRALKAGKTRVANGTPLSKRVASWKSGWREIGGVRKYYRSRWEANYARLLEWWKRNGIVAGWEHEPETFWFDKVKRGSVSYLPDFRVTFSDGRVEYHEVKGWMDTRSITKIRRMAKYHPKVTLVVIDGPKYRRLMAQHAGLFDVE